MHKVRREETNLFSRLLTFTRFMVKEQGEMSKKDRENSEVMMSITIYGLRYVVGKGGFVAAFYYDGDNERKVCHIKDIIKIVEGWSKAKYNVFCIYNSDKERIGEAYPTLEKVLATKPLKGYVIRGLGKNKATLFNASKGFDGKYKWMAIHKDSIEMSRQ